MSTIQNDRERYLWFLYFLVVFLSSSMGDSIILIASVRYDAMKLNRFIVAVMQHIAVCDLLRTLGWVLPTLISLQADRWILGSPVAYISMFLILLTFQVSNILICVLTSSKFMMLKFPERTRSWMKKGGHVVCVFAWLGSSIFVAAVFHRKDGIYFDQDRYTILFRTSEVYAVLVFKIVTIIIPTFLIVITTFSTLCYLMKSREVARTSGGRLRWQGMVTVTTTSLVYCISIVPYIVASFTIYRARLERTANFLTAINIMSNFYIYSLTIPSFRNFISSKVLTFCRLIVLMFGKKLQPASSHKGSTTKDEPGGVPNPTELTSSQKTGLEGFMSRQSQHHVTPT